MFLPTKSGLIGSSRWPRSTSTARRIALGRPQSSTASIAARAVLPVYITSSTITATLPSTSKGSAAGRLSGCPPRASGRPGRGRCLRSHRAPARPLSALCSPPAARERLAAALYAHQAQPGGPPFFSVISCARRMSARPSAAESIIFAFMRTKNPAFRRAQPSRSAQCAPGGQAALPASLHPLKELLDYYTSICGKSNAQSVQITFIFL